MHWLHIFKRQNISRNNSCSLDLLLSYQHVCKACLSCEDVDLQSVSVCCINAWLNHSFHSNCDVAHILLHMALKGHRRIISAQSVSVIDHINRPHVSLLSPLCNSVCFIISHIFWISLPTEQVKEQIFWFQLGKSVEEILVTLWHENNMHGKVRTLTNGWYSVSEITATANLL